MTQPPYGQQTPSGQLPPSTPPPAGYQQSGTQQHGTQQPPNNQPPNNPNNQPPNNAQQPAQGQQDPYRQEPASQQGGTRQESPWWAAGAQQDPWRDPRSPANWSPPTQQLPRDQWSGGPTQGASDKPRRGLGVVVAVALVTGLLAGGGAGVGGYLIADQSAADPATTTANRPLGAPASANRAPASVAGIAASVLPSVVSIQVTTSRGKGTGSGFVITQDGYILTNNHVVASAASGGKIEVAFKDGARSEASIKGRDAYSDVAVIKVSGKQLKPLSLGDSDSVAVGDPVVAVGSPLGLAGTVTSGIVSALNRPVRAGGSESEGEEDKQTFLSAVQTDAAINPGNSGGPLLDGSARVIGINSAIATLSSGSGRAGSIGLGFAIPIDQAKRVADQLIKTGTATRTIIGASVDERYEGPIAGARLGAIEPNGPAAKAGLKEGDVVTKFGKQPVEDPVSLIADIRAQAPRTPVTVEYMRDGRKGTATVTLGEA